MPDLLSSITDAAPIPPDVLARTVRYLNANAHDGQPDWVSGDIPGITDRVRVYAEDAGYFTHWLSPTSAVAVAVYCYGMDDPRTEIRGTTP